MARNRFYTGKGPSDRAEALERTRLRNEVGRLNDKVRDLEIDLRMARAEAERLRLIIYATPG